MEPSIAQAHLCKVVEIGRGNLSPESAPVTETSIVNHDEQHVGRALRSFDERNLVRLGILVCLADDPLKFGFGPGQNILGTHGRRKNPAECETTPRGKRDSDVAEASRS